MAFLSILLLAVVLGLLAAALVLMLAGSEAAERYPGFAILPGGLVVLDLGFSSQWGEFALLGLGGLFGYFLMLRLWKGRPELWSQPHASHGESSAVVPATPSSASASDQLADYL